MYLHLDNSRADNVFSIIWPTIQIQEQLINPDFWNALQSRPVYRYLHYWRKDKRDVLAKLQTLSIRSNLWYRITWPGLGNVISSQRSKQPKKSIISSPTPGYPSWFSSSSLWLRARHCASQELHIVKNRRKVSIMANNGRRNLFVLLAVSIATLCVGLVFLFTLG